MTWAKIPWVCCVWSVRPQHPTCAHTYQSWGESLHPVRNGFQRALLPSRDFPDDPDVRWDPERAADVLLRHVEANGIKLVRVHALLSSRDLACLSAPFLSNHRVGGGRDFPRLCPLHPPPYLHAALWKPRSPRAYASTRWHRTSIFMLGCHCNSGGKCCPNAHLHRGDWGSQRLRSCPRSASMKLGVWASIFPSRKCEDKSTAPVGRTFLVRAPVGIRFTCRSRRLRNTHLYAQASPACILPAVHLKVPGTSKIRITLHKLIPKSYHLKPQPLAFKFWLILVRRWTPLSGFLSVMHPPSEMSY